MYFTFIATAKQDGRQNWKCSDTLGTYFSLTMMVRVFKYDIIVSLNERNHGPKKFPTENRSFFSHATYPIDCGAGVGYLFKPTAISRTHGRSPCHGSARNTPVRRISLTIRVRRRTSHQTRSTRSAVRS